MKSNDNPSWQAWNWISNSIFFGAGHKPQSSPELTLVLQDYSEKTAPWPFITSAISEAKTNKRPFRFQPKVSPAGPLGFFMSFSAQRLCYEAVATPLALFKKITKHGLAGRVRLLKLPNKAADSIDKFVINCIAQGATIVSDDGTEFTNLKSLGFDHRPVPMRGDREKMDKHLPMISRVTVNLKTWIDGTFHSVGQKHLQAYLSEFMFRFNRRFYRSTSFRTLLGFGILYSGRTYKEVYQGNPSKN
jgi:hypothetical protein